MNLEGKQVREKIKQNLDRSDTSPCLAVIFVGDSDASESFIKKKKEMCSELGFRFTLSKFERGVSEKTVINEIEKMNENPDIHGILPQLPLPGIDENKVFKAIDPEKDVDGLTPENLGSLLRGDPRIVPGTVEAVMEILEHYDVEIEGQEVTIVNNSNLIGKPLSMAITNKMGTVTLCHEETKNMKKHTRQADILVTATGQPDLITSEMIKEDAVVVDAGYAKENGKVQGDVKFDEVKEKASKITPNPGGVCPVTVAATMQNLLKCYRMQQDKKGDNWKRRAK
jgi:methylenetetrahydrofolate dehydrogenase (NADP+)/methenyltetrahydrofolate cyclohydrolase